jgi:thymidylate kinase
VDGRLLTNPAGPAVRRGDVLGHLVALLEERARTWAWQGAADAVDEWVASTGPADLDVWCDAASAPAVAAAIDEWPAARVADAADPRRLRHISWVVETDAGPAVLDLTYGDLRVGAVLLVPEQRVTVDDEHRLTGAAGAADRLLRPLLRGRLPKADRLAEARRSWAGATDRGERAAEWSDQLGADVVDEVVAVLDGADPADDLPARVRRRLLARTVAPSAWSATWAQRRTVVPAGRAAGPVGLRTRGVVVVLVGTDGAGKSTVTEEIAERLRALGLPTRTAYFGMARGNLPGVGLARRVLGVAPAGDAATEGSSMPTPMPMPEPEVDLFVPDRLPDLAEQRAGLSHPVLRRAAAWYYAGEYVLRYLREVAPGVRRREVVLCDRYVYDLRESPWPGSPAARVAERLVPRPDVLVLPDAPVEDIHRRKPERAFAEQWAQQTRFRALVADAPARVASLRVDTSGAPGDSVARVVVAVLTAAHRARRR